MSLTVIAQGYIEKIKQSNATIYDFRSDCFIPDDILEMILRDKLIGKSLAGLALRTRSKRIKEFVCEALGYPIPSIFSKCQPRFLGQKFDTYAQKSNNLQIWNEDISNDRRYVILQIDANDCIGNVRVLSGGELQRLDTTGTLTHKLQAICSFSSPCMLLSPTDTNTMKQYLAEDFPTSFSQSPISLPLLGQILPIGEIFRRLQSLIGVSLCAGGVTQERNRGASLHEAICRALGYTYFEDSGQFPDIKHQLLEVKLQTSRTIDLGVFNPSDQTKLNEFQCRVPGLRHCDVRYAIFGGQIVGSSVWLSNLALVTGDDFFRYFPQCQGNTVNSKIQIPLPNGFWH